MFQKARRHKIRYLLAAALVYSAGVISETLPTPPTTLGAYFIEGTSIEGTTNEWLTSMGHHEDVLQSETYYPYGNNAMSLNGNFYDAYFINRNLNFLFSDSLTVKNSLGFCLTSGPALQYFPATGTQGIFTLCGNEANAAKYDPVSKQIFTPSNGGACLARVNIPFPWNTADSLYNWSIIFIGCNVETSNGFPVTKRWDFVPYPNPPKPTPSIINLSSEECLVVFRLQGPPISTPQLAVETCRFGAPEQNWVLNKDNQLVNILGDCVASYAKDTRLEVDTCKVDANHTWEFVNGRMLRNTATQQCLDSFPIRVSDCGAADDPNNIRRSWYALTEAPTPTNNLVAKNDSYAVTSNNSKYQGIDKPSASAVRVNDLPSGWPDGLTFELVSPITRTGGTGKAKAELYFRDSGGFYVLLKSDANSNANRRADKRGTYTFTYKMVMNGQSSAPATVTINVI